MTASNLISGKTVLYGVIGDPIDHSLSPAIQNAAFRSTQIDAVYVPFHVKPQNLRIAMSGLRALHVRGFNVTIPHKINVLPYLDKTDAAVSTIGSANTIINENGKLCGYNTDGLGAFNSLVEAGAQPNGKSVLIFGAGGASRAVAYTLAETASSIRLVNRTRAKAKQLANRLRKKFGTEITSTALSSAVLKDLVEQADIIVNASSMGMNGISNPPIEAKWLHSGQWVFDLVYTPPQTRLLELAASARANGITGLDMLVNQGACSFELWTGIEAPRREMRHAVAQKLLAMEHAKSS
jgi:shikimate dehydrogenase